MSYTTHGEHTALPPTVLYLVHALPPEEDTGTPLLAAGYAIEMARRGWNVTVLYASDRVKDWEEAMPFRLAGEEFSRVAVPPSPTRGEHWPLFAPLNIAGPASPATLAFERVLRQVAPDLFHVVDNVDLPLDWPDRAAALGIPVVRTVSCTEDLCGLIPPVSPMSDPVGYCLPPLTPERCARCLLSTGSFGRFAEDWDGAGSEDGVPDTSGRRRLIDLLERKRARMTTQYAETFSRVIFSSRAFRAYFERSAQLDPARVAVIPLGLDPIPGQSQPNAKLDKKEEGTPLVFGCAGTVSRAKGLDAVAAAFLHPDLLGRDDYRLVILGGGDESIIAELLARNPRVHWTGPYEPEELPARLAEIDVGLSTSRFETFHRVTREYLLSGVPVIGSSTAFGIPEVVQHGHNGLLFDHVEPGSLLRAVLACLDEPELLARITAGALATTIRSVSEEVDDLVALYGEVVHPVPIGPG
ncbi:MAG TPA: glycosyltransferase [Acidimicrobiales bacterium]|nr:glycosyltransferase [Acidimicrobiales bacterium]